MKIVICGGGIIGSSVAYHLALRGVTSTVVERCEPACAASGKAGGLLARDWCDTYELGPMANLSFDMHMEFANDENFRECDYRHVDTLGINVNEDCNTAGVSGLPEWLDGPILQRSVMGKVETTAQVHPGKLTHAMLSAANKLVGTTVKTGTVNDVQKDGVNNVTGVRVGEEIISADVVVIALGPWSVQATEWFDLASIRTERAHSIILQPAREISAHACFLEYSTSSNESFSPEVYPRPDGTVYACGMCDTEPLPADPSQVEPNAESCKTLRGMVGAVSSCLRDAPLLTEQACFLPLSPDGLPLIGAIPKTKGAYIATGHSCWGILNAPATGKAMAELILDGHCALLDITPFDPARFLHSD